MKPSGRVPLPGNGRSALVAIIARKKRRGVFATPKEEDPRIAERRRQREEYWARMEEA